MYLTGRTFQDLLAARVPAAGMCKSPRIMSPNSQEFLGLAKGTKLPTFELDWHEKERNILILDAPF